MTDIQHAATRILAVAQSWHDDPTATQAVADGMRSLSGYLARMAAIVESEIAPPGDFPGLPFDVPNIPEYKVPTLADCDWTVENGVYTSCKGLPDASSVNEAYRASREAGLEGPVTFGVWDKIGRAVVGGLWNGDSDHSITERDEGGSWVADLSVEFVGLGEDCEVQLGWSATYGFPAYIGAFNIGLRGGNDSFIIRANTGVGKLIIDGCWWLQCADYTGTQRHASGMHIDKWGTLVWRNHQFKGTLLREHSSYLKSCNGEGTWIIGNDLRGGNRTGFQVRPQSSDNNAPKGPLVIANNFAHGYGWEHENADGGSCMTVWSNPTSDTYIFDNEITDARYGCLVLSTQGPERNFLNANGYPIKSLYLHGNKFENSRATRSCVSISSVEEVNLYSSTVEGGPFTLDASWAMRVGGIANGTVKVHDFGYVRYLASIGVRTFDPSDWTATIAMPTAQIVGYAPTTTPTP